jgi:hypothetical protein
MPRQEFRPVPEIAGLKNLASRRVFWTVPENSRHKGFAPAAGLCSASETPRYNRFGVYTEILIIHSLIYFEPFCIGYVSE